MPEDRRGSWWDRATRWLLPPARTRLVPYTAFEVLAVFFVSEVFWPGLGFLLVVQTHLGDWLYGTEAMSGLRNGDPDGEIRLRVTVLAIALVAPLRILSVPHLLRQTSNTQPYQLGLTLSRLKQYAVLGVIAFAVVTPFVLGINWLATAVFSELSENSVTEHGFAKLSQSESVTGIELALIVFLATAVAPAIEELLFRGVLLNWLGRNVLRADAVMAVVGAYAVAGQLGKWESLRGGNWMVLAPVLFVLAMTPGYAWVRHRQRMPEGTALYASSMLFAIFHQSVWPSPIPLFVLALALGWLAQRTRSLTGPMVMHSLFNGVACVQMLTGYS